MDMVGGRPAGQTGLQYPATVWAGGRKVVLNVVGLAGPLLDGGLLLLELSRLRRRSRLALRAA